MGSTGSIYVTSTAVETLSHHFPCSWQSAAHPGLSLRESRSLHIPPEKLKNEKSFRHLATTTRKHGAGGLGTCERIRNLLCAVHRTYEHDLDKRALKDPPIRKLALEPLHAEQGSEVPRATTNPRLLVSSETLRHS